ncbi:MAG: prolyl oligopeptidase family serine peptidase [Acidobacteriaceae bacterium]
MRANFSLPAFVLFSTMIGIASAQAPAPHAYTVHDWAAARGATPLMVSPDGATILYRVSYGAESGDGGHEFWFIHPDGTGASKLTLPDGFSPSGFLPDGGALYGSWEVNGKPQFAVFAMNGDKAADAPTTLVVLPRGVNGMLPSPDGTLFALLGDPRAPDPLDAVRTVIEPSQTSLYVAHADGTGGKWLCGAEHNLAGGPGAFGLPIAWSPDGSELALLASSPKIGNHDMHSTVELCSVASGDLKHVTTVDNAAASMVFIGPAEIAFLSTTAPTQTPDHLYTVPTSGGTATDRTPDLQTTTTAMAADARGHVFVAIAHGVRSEVDTYRDGKLTPAYMWPDGGVNLPVFSTYKTANGQTAFSVSDPTHTPNVAVATGNELRRITHEGDKEIASIALGPVRVVHWTSKGGVALEGIATFPAGYVEGKKYPFLVLPHGGPEANDELSLDPLARIIAGLGYVVLQPEYRGSTGFGDAHLAAIYQHFGDRAYEDVDSATDYAIAQGWADPQRLAIFGWSAGGFMTSWTVTQTHRYKVAIEGAGITDWGSFIFTSDVPQTDYDARWPEEDPKAFERFSAVDFAKNVTTPLLILHGAADVRVPTYQGREFYEVLADRGKTVRMVTYPGSGHFPHLWQQRIDIFNEIDAWLARYNP